MESKAAESAAIARTGKTALGILVVLTVSLARADDFKTSNGNKYKNATVTRVEPDGITVKFSGGIVKIPFTDLSKELQNRYDYRAEAAQRFAAETAAQIKALNASAATEIPREQAEKLLRSATIVAVVTPSRYGKEETQAGIQQYEQYWKGPTAYDWEWRAVGKEFRGVIDETMPDYYEDGDVFGAILYKIGHTDDSNRRPVFTLDKEKAIKFLSAGK